MVVRVGSRPEPLQVPGGVSRPLSVLAVVTVNALLAVVATYAALRAYDVFFKKEPNPATIVWSAHIAMFWRLGVGVYVAGMVSVLVFMLARQNLGLATRLTAALVPIVGAMIALQGALLP
jgi:hypothetical protein